MAPSVGKPAAREAEDDLLLGASREEWFGRISGPAWNCIPAWSLRRISLAFGL